MSTALYRRYRPDTFADVIGQEHVTTPLMTALSKDRVNHAYLFSGPRGCGKTTSARILARCLNCAEGPTPNPCGSCESCVELASGGSGSLDVIEIDAASHGGVEDARDLRERATFAPTRDRFKIFIIDEAHMVTSAGFNALLKIVEEPPAHIKFIFATTEPDKVIGTIRSRTHHYPFRLVPPEALLQYLETLCERENVTVHDGVLPLVIRAGGGSVRDTLSVLDQLIAGARGGVVDYETAVALLGYTHATLLDEVALALHEADGASLFGAIDRIVQTGLDPRRFVEDLLERFRDLIIAKAVPEGLEKILRGMPGDQLASLQDQAALFGAGELSRWADVTNQALTDMTGATSPRLHLELLAARLLLPAADGNASSMAARLDRLERHATTGGALPELTEGVDAPAAPSGMRPSPETNRQGAAAVREALAAARARKQGGDAAPSPGAQEQAPTPASPVESASQPRPEAPQPPAVTQHTQPEPDDERLDASDSLNTGADADWGGAWGPVESTPANPVTTPVDPQPSVPAERPEGVSPFSLVPDPNSGEDLSFGTGVPIDDVKQNAAMAEFAKRAAAQRQQQQQHAAAERPAHSQPGISRPEPEFNQPQMQDQDAVQRERLQREENARREQAEREQAQRAEAQRAEQQRQAEENARREQAEREQAQRAEAQRAEQQRQAEENARRDQAQRAEAHRAEQQRQAEENARREQAEREQAQRQEAQRDETARQQAAAREQAPNAEQHAQQPAAATPPTGGVQAFQQAWPTILEQLQGNSRVLHSMLANYASIGGFDGRTLTLAFSNAGPVVNLRNRPDMMGLLTSTISQVMRQQVDIVLTEGGAGPTGGGSPKGERRFQPASAPVTERPTNAVADAPAPSSPAPSRDVNPDSRLPSIHASAAPGPYGSAGPREEPPYLDEPPYPDEPPYDPYEDAYPAEGYAPAEVRPAPARQAPATAPVADSAVAPSPEPAQRLPRTFDGPPIAPPPRMTAGMAARQEEEGSLPVSQPTQAFNRPVSDVPLRPGSTTDSFPQHASPQAAAGHGAPSPDESAVPRAAAAGRPDEPSAAPHPVVPPAAESQPEPDAGAAAWGQPAAPVASAAADQPGAPVQPAPGQRLSRYQQLMNQSRGTTAAPVQPSGGSWGQPQASVPQRNTPQPSRPEPEEFVPSDDDIEVEDSALIGVPAIERLLDGMVIEQRDANGNIVEIRRSL